MMQDLVINLIVAVICGFIAAAIASSKSRSTVGWFFGGFFLGCIGIIIVACLSNLKKEKARQDRITRDNRRLREQLQQERLKGEAFRQHTMGRLDSHDEALSMDTRALPMSESTPLLEDPEKFFDNLERTSGSQQGVPVPVARSPSPTPALSSTPEKVSRQWHYETGGKTIGPVPESQIVSMLRTGQLDGSTLVWTEQLGDWKAVKHIRGLKKFLPS